MNFGQMYRSVYGIDLPSALADDALTLKGDIVTVPSGGKAVSWEPGLGAPVGRVVEVEGDTVYIDPNDPFTKFYRSRMK